MRTALLPLLLVPPLLTACDGDTAHSTAVNNAAPAGHCGAAVPGGLQTGFLSPLVKVYREPPYEHEGKLHESGLIRLARNEYEGTQLVLCSTDPRAGITLEVSALLGDDGRAPIPPSAVEWHPVAHVRLATATVPGSRTGWLPDPLLPPGPLSLAAETPQSLLITVRTERRTPPGRYRGTVVIRQNDRVLRELTLRVEVWRFSLPERSGFKSAAFTGWDRLQKAWPVELGYPQRSDDARLAQFLRLADLGFRNRLPPVGFPANGLESSDRRGRHHTGYGFPTHDTLPDGTPRFNAARTDRIIDHLLARGANHFFIAFTSDIDADPQTAQQRRGALVRYLRDYTTHLRRRGLLGIAYVYGVDEPWGEAVAHAQRTHALVKQAVGADVRFMQNTNQDNDRVIPTLLGHFDTLDINLGFYERVAAERHRTQIGELWWNVNLWPATHPNLFLEFPWVDARMIGPLSYKYRVDGFEYWDLIALGGIENYRPLEPGALLTGWTVTAKSLDGTLVYPATDGTFYSSMRFENFRDGMEDLEYLRLLERVDPRHPLLRVPIARGLSDYVADAAAIERFRATIGEALDRAAAGSAPLDVSVGLP